MRRFFPLYWCDNCNVPLLVRNCCLCGNNRDAREVAITPPGDVKPAFKGELQELRRVIDQEFGEVGPNLTPSDRVVLLNKVPHQDLAYEVIVDGYVIGLWRFEVESSSWSFLPSMEGARRLALLKARKWVIADRGAEEAVAKGANLLAPGVVALDDGIRGGDQVYVVNEEGLAIAVGKVPRDFNANLERGRGIVVKVRQHAKAEEAKVNTKGSSWEDVIVANKRRLEEIEERAARLVRDVYSKEAKPVVVSFSGGKDSLAVLLLAMKALSKDFYVVFSNTGVEYPDNVSYVHRVVKALDLQDKFLEVKANVNFFNAMEIFGPPARDYRWCCKVCKLAPTARALREVSSGESLVLVGLRALESSRRRSRGAFWRSIWIKGQVALSPIYDWSTLEVWLYLMWKNVEVNPLYEKGLERIGCWVCPSMELAEISKTMNIMGEEWHKYMEKVSGMLNMSEQQLKYGLWRWRYKEPFKRKQRKAKGVLDFIAKKLRRSLKVKVEDEVLQRFLNILKTLYDVEQNDCEIYLHGEGEEVLIKLIEGGEILVKGSTKKSLIRVLRCLSRASMCLSCMLCITTCTVNAISMTQGGVSINEKRCVRCGECNYTCPIWVYSVRSKYLAKRLLD